MIDITALTERVREVIIDFDCCRARTSPITSIERLGGAPFAIGSRALLRQRKLPPAIWKITSIEPGNSIRRIGGGLGVRILAVTRWNPPPLAAGQCRRSSIEGSLGTSLAQRTKEIAARYLGFEANGLMASSRRPSFRHAGVSH